MTLDMRDVRVGGSAVRGTPAKAILAPNDLGEAAQILGEAAARGHAVAFLGGGTELGLGYPPARVDVLVKTSRLARIVEYAPADMVVEAEAGMTLAALQKHLAPHGQRLALDVPYPELATLGGIVATNGFGPRRMRFGSVRDLIVGVSLIRADGTRVRGGGKVVKNVAGFDLPKLAVGSIGSLGMIATATFRLHPLPEATRALRMPSCDGAALADLAKAVTERRLEPSALVAVRAGTAYDAYVLFEGFTAGVDEQAARFETLCADRGRPAERLDDPEIPAKLDENARTHGDVRVRIAVPPAGLVALETNAVARLTAAFAEAQAAIYPALGIAFVSGYAADAARAADALGEARRFAEAAHGNLVVLDVRDPALAERIDPWGTLPASLFLMKRLKDRFDPEHRLNPGRFLGGL